MTVNLSLNPNARLQRWVLHLQFHIQVPPLYLFSFHIILSSIFIIPLLFHISVPTADKLNQSLTSRTRRLSVDRPPSPSFGSCWFACSICYKLHKLLSCWIPSWRPVLLPAIKKTNVDDNQTDSTSYSQGRIQEQFWLLLLIVQMTECRSIYLWGLN